MWETLCDYNKIEELWYVLGFYYDSIINRESHERGVTLFERQAYKGENVIFKGLNFTFLYL